MHCIKKHLQITTYGKECPCKKKHSNLLIVLLVSEFMGHTKRSKKMNLTVTKILLHEVEQKWLTLL